MLRLLAQYLRPYGPQLSAVVALQLTQAVASLFLPTLNASIIDDGVAQADVVTIWRLGGVMLAVSVLQISAQIAAIWFGARIAMRFGRDLRESLFERGLSFSAREVGQFGAPTLITRNTNDVQQVQMLVLMTLTMIVSAPLTAIGGIFMALREDIGLSWLILVAIVALGALIGTLIAQMTPLYESLQVRIDTLNRVLREQISGLRVIRAFVREPTESARFDQANHDLTDLATRAGSRMALMFPSVFLVMNLSSVAVVWFGAFRIADGNLLVGQLTAYLAYLMQILMSVMMATMMLMLAPRAAVSSRRIRDVLATETSVRPPERPKTPALRRGELRVEGVGFAYPGAEQPVLSEVSFTALPGTTTAIIGSTGSGKTTLVRLLPRLIDATAGRILVDGVDVRELDPAELGLRVGIVPQRPYLFSGTVASNLRMGNPDATDEELWWALEIAQARDFVEAMPGGLAAPIAQGGTNVSGGQRQRIAIARTVIRRPNIIVFDDAFSALDVATDARLRRALAPVVHDATVVTVAQRVSTIRDADRILVLDAGRVVGEGTHDALLRHCETYREIVASQLRPEDEGVLA